MLVSQAVHCQEFGQNGLNRWCVNYISHKMTIDPYSLYSELLERPTCALIYTRYRVSQKTGCEKYCMT